MIPVGSFAHFKMKNFTSQSDYLAVSEKDL